MNPTVIVVDDDPSLVDLVCDILNDEAIPTDSCPHGHVAHACIRRKQPKALLLDIQMPQVDGIELFRLLRADPETATIPVIFFTANARRVLQWYPNFTELDAVLLPKPFDVERLIDTVTQTLARYDTSR